ncbi:MAG: exosortase-associated EpsI family protein [Planctomycetota bacterium]|nr:exosortase-associated EpsI family protein [Planctomycetota bacterium]
MKRHIFIAIATIIVCGLTLASGVIQGQFTNRWGAPPVMLSAAEQLKGVPTQFGDWRMLEEGEMDEISNNMLELAGYVKRSYVNEATGQTVHVAVLLGPAGRISVHTPEVCFSSRDYDLKEERERTPITNNEADDNLGDLWRLTFKSRDVSRHLLSVYYGWSQGGPWAAAEGPRWKYAGSPYLYKIQLAAQLPPGQAPEKSDPGKNFLVDFLPVLQPHLKAQ